MKIDWTAVIESLFAFLALCVWFSDEVISIIKAIRGPRKSKNYDNSEFVDHLRQGGKIAIRKDGEENWREYTAEEFLAWRLSPEFQNMAPDQKWDMKKVLTLCILTLATILPAQTYTNGAAEVDKLFNETNAPAAEADKIWTKEFTLSGSGITTKHGTEFGVDVGYETNPFKWAPALWVEYDQGLAWSPDFAGSSDLTFEYSLPLRKDVLYFNVGWSGGAVYDAHSPLTWRSGPEFNLQWFTFDHAFIFAGLNFDAFRTHGDREIRPTIGIGMTW